MDQCENVNYAMYWATQQPPAIVRVQSPTETAEAEETARVQRLLRGMIAQARENARVQRALVDDTERRANVSERVLDGIFDENKRLQQEVTRLKREVDRLNAQRRRG